jgi:16S rRNA (cytidine1402-2'-O)-methyltransferase
MPRRDILLRGDERSDHPDFSPQRGPRCTLHQGSPSGRVGVGTVGTGPEHGFTAGGYDEAVASKAEDGTGRTRRAEARRWVKPGTLYLVGTPIGNRADVGQRALEVLAEADLIAAEDTRVSGVWLRAVGVRTPLVSFHAHSKRARLDEIIARLRQGEVVAVVTDAGMPAVADPGRELVEAAVKAGIPVSAVPGPNAAVTAFALSGFPLPVTIWGFLPARGREREASLESLAEAPGTQVFYEAPHRIRDTLAALSARLAGRSLVVARELTKIHEEIWRGDVDGALAWLEAHPPRGEFTVVVGPRQASQPQEPDWDALLEQVAEAVSHGASDREAVRAVAEAAGASRRELYRRWHRETFKRPATATD